MKKEEKINITGMSCVMCSTAVTKALSKTAGVENCNVNFATGDAHIEYDNEVVSLQELEDIIIKTGFGIKKPEKDELSEKENFYRQDMKKMIIAWLFAGPLMLFMLLHMFYMEILPHSFHTIYPWLAIIFSLLLYIFPGRQTVLGSIKSTRNATPSMDVLITIGCLSAFLTGCFPKIFGNHSFIEIGAMIMAIHLTGRYIEAKTKGKTSEAIRKLMEMGAKSASILQDNKIIEIPISDLKIGDIMVIKAGAKVPTDGIVTEGESYIDESMATGESMPVRKSIGNFVFGATINGNGSLQVEVTKIGKDTFLSQMIKLVEHAQNTKVPVQAFADKVTGGFVPIVLLIAFATFLIHLFYPEIQSNITQLLPFRLPWLIDDLSTLAQALFTAISVLVIACPCALGLATPTAIMAGIGLGTKHGIIIRNGEAVQVIQDADTIIFDKTGTLTAGKPVVTNFEVYTDDKHETLQAIYSLEKLSDHPLAQAIVNNLTPFDFDSLEIKDYETISGKGVIGTIINKNNDSKEAWTVGSLKFLEENFIDFQDKKDTIVQFQQEAKTVVVVAKDMKLRAIIAIADTIKEDAYSTIKMLHKMKIKTVMLTGDNAITAKEVAAKLGIMEVKAEVLPEEKLNFVKLYQNQSEKTEKSNTIIMVGDGINDAPALKQADVSIAIGGGTDIAIETADIVLVRNEVLPVVKSIVLSKTIFKVIKQNLFWAFFYNIIAIPLAFCGLLHPIIAEIAMALSSITVVSNANRLRNKKLSLPNIPLQTRTDN